jgi:hypothetical protein
MDLPAEPGWDPNKPSMVGRRCSNGQSSVELTLIVPLVLATLYIPMDFGIAFFTAQRVQNATREAARIGASMNPFVAGTIENEATKRLPGGKFRDCQCVGNFKWQQHFNLHEKSSGHSSR